jgi:hypothetical protein
VLKNSLKFARFSLADLPIGHYMFRVMAVSLAGKGTPTDFHEFFIVKPEKVVSKGWIILCVVIVVTVICVSVVSYYYKHKIVMWKQKNDRIHLLDEIEPIDFNDISMNRDSDSDR